MSKPNWYTRVVIDLLNYKEYKQRVERLQYKLDNKLEASAYSYSQGGSPKTNSIFDSAFEKVIDRLESDEAEEFREKFDIVNLVEIAIAGLDERERVIIERKYMTGRNVDDVKIYTHPEFEPGKTKYYEIKDGAVEKIARILGYI